MSCVNQVKQVISEHCCERSDYSETIMAGDRVIFSNTVVVIRSANILTLWLVAEWEKA